MEVLEELRMLLNLETSRHKLLQVILVGQLELAAKLRHPNLRQLQQRIAVAAVLKPLTAPEVEQYNSILSTGSRLRGIAGKGP